MLKPATGRTALSLTHTFDQKHQIGPSLYGTFAKSHPVKEADTYPVAY